MTGKVGTLRDPLIVAPILPVPSGWATDKVCLLSNKSSIIMKKLTIGLERSASLTCSAHFSDHLTEIGGYLMLEILEV